MRRPKAIPIIFTVTWESLVARLNAYYPRDLKHDRNRHSHVWYRWYNEFPVLLLVGNVNLVVVRPF